LNIYKPVCDFLLAIIVTDIPSRSYRCLLFKFWTLRFRATFWGLSLGTTYDVHLGLIGKRVVDFSLVLIEHFSLGVTAEAL